MHRIKRYGALLLALLLLTGALCACAGEGKPTPYAGEHIHTFGPWQDATEVAADGSRVPAGQIRYCKICNAEERR